MSKPNFFPAHTILLEQRDWEHKHYQVLPKQTTKTVTMASKKLASTTQKAKPVKAAVTKKTETKPAKPAKREPAAKQDTKKPG
jgi:hypothetical protein